MPDVERENKEAMLTAADAAFDAGEFEEALDSYLQALAHSPTDIEARVGIALCLMHLHRPEEAVPLLAALEPILPDSDQLQFMLAEGLCQTGRLDEAQARLEALVRRSPAMVQALSRLGRIYMDRNRNREANDCFTKAVEHDPENVDALTCLGLLMIKYCQFDNALTALHRARAREPENVLVLNNLGRACKMMGRHDEALSWYRKGLLADPSSTCVIDNYLLALNYCADLDPQFIADEHRRLAVHYAPKKPPVPPVRPKPSHGGRLRVGYVSADFYTHSVSYFLEPVLQHHDRTRFEIFCYAAGSADDDTTTRLKSLSSAWRDVRTMTPGELAALIRQDEIDILVDLSGHTADNRLCTFAARPAPLQVSWIGYPNTSGLPEMDYFITDTICAPSGTCEHLFSERLWRLPRSFCCYYPPVEFPPISGAPCRENGFITFGSFNNFGKVTASQIRLWAAIVRAVPGSVLYLKSMSLGERSVKEAVLELFAKEGVEPERIRMRIITTTPLEHLQEYGQVDIALDTFPYNGTTTTCEAMWMGTPVVTLCGSTHVSRVGASFLSHVGCPDLIAVSADEYVERAVVLANDPARLLQLREELRGKMARSPVMDAPGVTREVEAAFCAMYREKRRSMSDAG